MRSVGVEFLGFIFIFLTVLAIVRADLRGRRAAARRVRPCGNEEFTQRVQEFLPRVVIAARHRNDEIGDAEIRALTNDERLEIYLATLKAAGAAHGFIPTLGKTNGAPVVRLRYPNTT